MPKITKEPVKSEENVEQNLEQNLENVSIADLYKDLVAKTVKKSKSTIPSKDVYKHLEDLFEQSGQEALMFAPAQRVVKTMMASTEKNFYNRVKSAIEAKTSPFETFDGEDGHVYVRRKAVKA